MRFNDIQPQGEYRAELRHGALMALTCNMQRDTKTNPEPWKPVDFMHFHEKPPEKVIDLSDEQTQAQIDHDVFGM